MKIESTVVGLSAAALCMMTLTGCQTTESQGSGRGPGARHKGIVAHQHPGRVVEGSAVASATEEDPYAAYPVAGEFDDASSIDSSDMGNEGYMVEPSDTSSSSSDIEVYIVKNGDVLSQIAVDFDTTTATLIDMNNLSNPDVLYVGQELKVPAGRGGAKTTIKSSSGVKKGGSYMIQKGDTLSGIAIAAGVSIDDLRSVNNMNDDRIMAGDILTIPSYGKVPSNTQKVTGTSSKPKTTSTPDPQPEPSAAAPEIAQPQQADVYSPAPAVPVVESSGDIMVEEKMLYPGETLDDVARQYGVSKAEIMRMNNLNDESEAREGMRLRIPIAE